MQYLDVRRAVGVFRRPARGDRQEPPEARTTAGADGPPQLAVRLDRTGHRADRRDSEPARDLPFARGGSATRTWRTCCSTSVSIPQHRGEAADRRRGAQDHRPRTRPWAPGSLHWQLSGRNRDAGQAPRRRRVSVAAQSPTVVIERVPPQLLGLRLGTYGKGDQYAALGSFLCLAFHGEIPQSRLVALWTLTPATSTCRNTVLPAHGMTVSALSFRGRPPTSPSATVASRTGRCAHTRPPPCS